MSDIQKYLQRRQPRPGALPQINREIVQKAIEKRVKKQDPIDIAGNTAEGISTGYDTEERFFRCQLSINKKQTTIKLRLSLVLMYVIITDVTRSLSGGYADPVKIEIERIAKDYPRDCALRGLSGFISDTMVLECLEELENLKLLPNTLERYEWVKTFLDGSRDK